ncbi:nuclease-related domain-containing protein [Amphibacillus jilinensis]|uniref:nuclease-related domain-containing protein n=1 Tax=Amphibacillus jilinensis TaxID=1216008 RepID=UPI000305966A|nr:nuclease-related domain-containing protein [Amphibacillus jilinensis]
MIETILTLEQTELLQQLEVVSRRYQKRDQRFERIQDHYRREKAGFNGEKQLDYYLKLTPLSQACQLAALRLRAGDHYFQIDRLVLTRSACYVIEVKHLSGQVYFNKARQFIQLSNGNQRSYPDPLNQVQLQSNQLAMLMSDLGYFQLPIHPMVVLSHDQVLLNDNEHEDLILIQQLPERLTVLDQRYQVITTFNQIRKLANRLKQLHVKKQEDVLAKYDIPFSEIQVGVHCRHCKKGHVIRLHGNWQCPVCKNKDDDAHLDALLDYRKLISRYITNKQARYFLKVDSPYTIRRLFLKAQLPFRGKGKHTQYDLNTLI